MFAVPLCLSVLSPAPATVHARGSSRQKRSTQFHPRVCHTHMTHIVAISLAKSRAQLPFTSHPGLSLNMFSGLPAIMYTKLLFPVPFSVAVTRFWLWCNPLPFRSLSTPPHLV
jgi:hypothetical protein